MDENRIKVLNTIVMSKCNVTIEINAGIKGRVTSKLLVKKCPTKVITDIMKFIQKEDLPLYPTINKGGLLI